MKSQSASGRVPSIPSKCLFRSDPSAFNTAGASSVIPRTLDELWDLLNESQQISNVYSIDDAVFQSEQEESDFWTRFNFEGADDREHPPP
jgi:hypothetical protein